ncbi:HAD family hydrolase [Actinokineospora sp.]|uniref:HAD family hydrolase n=1 Tax=Actinokineospora sp. TaxID=1872133 RepID=UPI004037B324
MGRPRGAAFFDVDETLITRTSAIDFLDYRMSRSRDPQRSAWSLLRPAAGLPRERATHEYFRLYQGFATAEVAAQGRAWFAEALRGGMLFHPPVLAELRAHAGHGRSIVLVSGSFPACLDPIAAEVGADAVLCSVPVVADGVYTGATERSMIGAEKALAVRRYLAEHDLDPGQCHAYGDHASDLPLLGEVGNPVVVGDDPELAMLADERGWRRLPGAGAHRAVVTRFLVAGAPPP